MVAKFFMDLLFNKKEKNKLFQINLISTKFGRSFK